MGPLLDTGIGEPRNLAERIRQGDAAAETELVREFSRRIFVMGLVRTRDRETAHDLVQETLMAVITALRNGHLRETDRLAAFVHGTARNLINSQLRSQRQAPRLELLTEDVAHTTTIAAQVEQAERIRLVRHVLKQLGQKDRRILWLTLVEGQKPAEIAAQLGVTSEAVRTRKLRATKKVAELIKKKMLRS